MLDEQMREVSTLIQQGALALAEQRLLRLLAEFPDDPATHRQMALLASSSGRPELALQHMAKASRLAPDSGEFHFQLGCLLAHSGQYEQALQHFKATTSALPDFADGWYFLGITLVREKRDSDALPVLRTAHQLAPDNLKTLRALADVEFKVGFPADGLPLWQELEWKQPDNVDVRLRIGETLSRLGFHDRAITLYNQALAKAPEEAGLWMALAQAQEDSGNRLAAQQAYEQALALKPNWAFPISGLLGLQRGNVSEALVAQAMLLQKSASLPDPERALLGYELGKVHDSRGEYKAAMFCWKDANSARQRITGKPDPQRLERSVDKTIEIFQPELFQRFKGIGSTDTRFVFVVGMPRSGTTLTEQIMASHPNAFGCGELPDVALIARNLSSSMRTRQVWPEVVTSMTDTMLTESISRYSEAATRHAPTSAERLIDKAPLNFMYLGLVALMFPAARVIWCRRDPRDIAVSIYGENFAVEERLATSLEGIGHYINQQNRLMRHWQSMNLPIMELNYESLVSDIEVQAMKLLSFVGLPWDPACLEFHKSERGVQTPSRWQVKQPVHTRSIGRWRNYSSELAPLLETLDLDAPPP